MQETLIHGVGMRFAVANWIMAAWAVCFVSTPAGLSFWNKDDQAQTLQFFIGAEILLLLNLLNVWVAES
jgi:hypothetical protein